MPLFRDNPVRSAVITAVALSAGYYVATSIQSSHAFQLTTTSIAMLSVAILMFMITLNHQHERHEGREGEEREGEGREGERRGRPFLTQSQTEAALIGAFALFWIVLLLGIRSYFGGSGGSTAASSSDLGTSDAATTKDAGRGRASKHDWDPPPCRGAYCMYEEWTYY